MVIISTPLKVKITLILYMATTFVITAPAIAPKTVKWFTDIKSDCRLLLYNDEDVEGNLLPPTTSRGMMVTVTNCMNGSVTFQKHNTGCLKNGAPCVIHSSAVEADIYASHMHHVQLGVSWKKRNKNTCIQAK